MSILVNKDTRLLVQGITGHEGLFHTQQMLAYGTNVVAGVRPGKGGEWVLDGKVPVFDSCRAAVEVTGANASIIFVSAAFAPDAIYEAADAEIPFIVCITEGIPVQDMMRVRAYLDLKGVRLLGPNCPGVLTPGEAKVGIIPGDIAIRGNIGIVSRSGTLTYEVLYALKLAGLGATTCVGIGGDPIVGSDFIDVLQLFEDDEETQLIVMVGEIGGDAEERAADKREFAAACREFGADHFLRAYSLVGTRGDCDLMVRAISRARLSRARPGRGARPSSARSAVSPTRSTRRWTRPTSAASARWSPR